MAETAKIYVFPQFRPSGADPLRSAETSARDVTETNVPAHVTDVPAHSEHQVEFDDLYPRDEETLTRSLRSILLENEARCRAARDEDDIERDDAISRLAIDLASVFALKGLTPALEIVIVSLYHAIRNNRAKALSLEQFNEVLMVIRDLSNSPYLSIDEALDLAEKLHIVGLNTDIQEADLLDEMINE